MRKKLISTVTFTIVMNTGFCLKGLAWCIRKEFATRFQAGIVLPRGWVTIMIFPLFMNRFELFILKPLWSGTSGEDICGITLTGKRSHIWAVFKILVYMSQYSGGISDRSLGSYPSTFRPWSKSYIGQLLSESPNTIS